jgi:hypothetical protein
MGKTEMIIEKMCDIKSSDIIYDLGIPRFIKENLTMKKLCRGIPIDFFEDESFTIAVDLGDEKHEYYTLKLNITDFGELYCESATGFRRNESRENFDRRIKEQRNNGL